MENKKEIKVEELNIFQKMLKITEEISVVAKNLEVGYGKNTYKAVSEADILHAVKPIENKYGVYSFPFEREQIKDEWFEQGERSLLFMRIKTIYRFVNIDNPQEFIDITTYGDGVDSQDKGCGKAMTYADKYALMKAYKIQTGDDPDKDPSGDLKKKTPAKAIEELQKDLLEEAKNLPIDLAALAESKKKKPEQLTNEDLKDAIKLKKALLQRIAAKQAAEKKETEKVGE